MGQTKDQLIIKLIVPHDKPNMDQERIAMEGNAELVHTMMTVCRERTLKKTHTGGDLSATEKTEFQNCILKYFETPNHIMSAMQSMAGGMQ